MYIYVHRVQLVQIFRLIITVHLTWWFRQLLLFNGSCNIINNHPLNHRHYNKINTLDFLIGLIIQSVIEFINIHTGVGKQIGSPVLLTKNFEW